MTANITSTNITSTNITTTNSSIGHGTAPPGIHITDGGLETSLIFDDGVDLPDFAAFPLVVSLQGRDVLQRYYRRFLDVAASLGVGMVLDTPTWRANPDWGTRLGYDPERLFGINHLSVQMVRAFAEGYADVVINGVVGPRGDGYHVGTAMNVDEATRYHGLQARAFASADVDCVTAVTMTYAAEAIGVVRACGGAGVPCVIGFTVETDGRLPSGQPLGDAIAEVDAATDAAPVDFMVNCAHPSHFADALQAGSDWCARIGVIRPNASRLSHDELDAAEELDRGDPDDLAAESVALCDRLPNLRVVGGCCGTDHEHIAALGAAFAGRASRDGSDR